MKRLQLVLKKEIFLVLLPLFFVVHGFVTFYPAIPLKDAAGVLLRYLLIITAILLFHYFFFRSFSKAAWFTFWLFVLQFFFGPLHDGLKTVAPSAFFSKHIFLFLLFACCFITFFNCLKRTKKDITGFYLYTNTLLLLWLLIDLGSLSFKPQKTSMGSHYINKAPCDTCHLPDVYFIIADEYAGTNALKKIFAFDNTNFEDSLRARDFYVLQNTSSNYNYTPYSIASILSMDYLNGITRRSNDHTNRRIAYDAINNNILISELRNMGYDFINLSPFDFADIPTQVNTQFFLTREMLITGQTYTQRLMKDIGFNFVTRFKIKPLLKHWTSGIRDVNEKFIHDTKEAALKPTHRPRFIYTHLFMPHYPYYFNEDGKAFPVESLVEGEQVNKQQYIAYLKYCNKRFLEILDGILKNSKEPPIIVFMGDHGFRHFNGPVEQKYHFMNFNAVYLPNKNYNPFNKKFTAVNQFRLILNTQFNKNFALLKDSTSFLEEY